VSLVDENGQTIPELVRKAEELTPLAVLTRYPGIARPITEQEYEEAVEIADPVIRWAEQLL
jgi:HEPN domain-containing protein